MIRKIQNHEYLKRYDNMSAAECAQYAKRVGEWLETGEQALNAKTADFDASVQNILQVSAGWNDQECQVFEEGVRLLSALMFITPTWLPDMLYVKSAKRCVRLMLETLRGVEEYATTGSFDGKTSEPGNGVRMQAGEAKEKLFTADAEEAASGSPDAQPATQDVAPFQGPADGHIAGGDNKGEGKKEDVRGKMDDGTLNPEPLTVSQDMVPARPNHIDQYVHLLPQKTQERAAKYGPLMRELDETREKERLLMDDPAASAKDREALAKRITAIDKEIRSIKDELDDEWEKLAKSGRVVVDDLGNARILPPKQGDEQQPAAETPQAPVELTSEQKAKRRDLRKWLVDTRRGNGDTRDEHVKKWKDNFKEYLTLEGDAAYADEKVKAAAEHYGIDMASLNDK